MSRGRDERRGMTRLLKLCKRAGLGLCVTIAVVWIMSGWAYLQWTGSVPGLERFSHFGVYGGRVYAEGRFGLSGVGWSVGADDGPAWRWGFTSGSVFAHGWYIPLWAPFLLVAALTTLLWRHERRTGVGFCRCGYDLAGLSSKVCPECGRTLTGG